ncbi:hypothetical protein DFA_11279 [Cavenderia fasciculata]|uniref:Uncharacterized protein n=1 Tax=Cavenderia fasciculata TaxID=261658 RepID=F4QC31_CACFS|nr:uncharacterized protein DFA_11279 [Cavenderia fasciculata]EGG13518.1 hypothetical protein DFA_11279 [Cavenderia fasciculata]|eukprot:XP_004350222.1 hypothetical protein DFA_11279 [Cavenderia fasciculata]
MEQDNYNNIISSIVGWIGSVTAISHNKRGRKYGEINSLSFLISNGYIELLRYKVKRGEPLTYYIHSFGKQQMAAIGNLQLFQECFPLKSLRFFGQTSFDSLMEASSSQKDKTQREELCKIVDYVLKGCQNKLVVLNSNTLEHILIHNNIELLKELTNPKTGLIRLDNKSAADELIEKEFLVRESYETEISQDDAIGYLYHHIPNKLFYSLFQSAQGVMLVSGNKGVIDLFLQKNLVKFISPFGGVWSMLDPQHRDQLWQRVTEIMFDLAHHSPYLTKCIAEYNVLLGDHHRNDRDKLITLLKLFVFETSIQSQRIVLEQIIGWNIKEVLQYLFLCADKTMPLYDTILNCGTLDQIKDFLVSETPQSLTTQPYTRDFDILHYLLGHPKMRDVAISKYQFTSPASLEVLLDDTIARGDDPSLLFAKKCVPLIHGIVDCLETIVVKYPSLRKAAIEKYLNHHVYYLSTRSYYASHSQLSAIQSILSIFSSPEMVQYLFGNTPNIKTMDDLIVLREHLSLTTDKNIQSDLIEKALTISASTTDENVFDQLYQLYNTYSNKYKYLRLSILDGKQKLVYFDQLLNNQESSNPNQSKLQFTLSTDFGVQYKMTRFVYPLYTQYITPRSYTAYGAYGLILSDYPEVIQLYIDHQKDLPKARVLFTSCMYRFVKNDSLQGFKLLLAHLEGSGHSLTTNMFRRMVKTAFFYGSLSVFKYLCQKFTAAMPYCVNWKNLNNIFLEEYETFYGCKLPLLEYLIDSNLLVVNETIVNHRTYHTFYQRYGQYCNDPKHLRFPTPIKKSTTLKKLKCKCFICGVV